MLLSIGMNIKLAKTVAVFNLPQRTTCPGATTLCKEICYAKKAERMYKSAKDNRVKNLQRSKECSFIDDILAELDQNAITKVRIHESGDFYSQAYLNKWLRIARLRPAILFLTYTRSTMLRFGTLPQNLILYASLDYTTPFHRWRAPSGLEAQILTSSEENNDGTHVCPPVTATHRNYCGSTCQYCWLATGNIAFLKH